MAKHETTVVLKAEDKTKRAFDSAERGMKNVDKSANMLAGTLRTVGGLLAGGQALSLAKNALAATDELTKTADRLGVTTDRLQELDFAASQSGVSFGTVTMGLQRFGRRLAEAADGGGAAKDALKELDIATTNADGTVRDTNEAFTEAVNKLGQMESGAKKTSLAFKLFDSEGVRLVQFGDKLDDLSQKARDLGLVIEEDLLRQSAKINDQFDIISRQIDTRFKKSVITGTQVVQQLAEQYARLALEVDAGLGGFFDDSSPQVLNSLEQVEKLTDESADNTAKLEKNTKKTASNLETIVDKTKTASLQADAFAQAFEIATDRTDELKSNLEKIKGLSEDRDRSPATVLGALTKSSQARQELSKGNVERASKLALEAAEELRRVEEESGESVTLAGTFIKNFEKIAQEALDKAEENQEQLKLVIEIDGQSKEYDFTKGGVDKAGKDTSAQLKKSEKKRA